MRSFCKIDSNREDDITSNISRGSFLAMLKDGSTAFISALVATQRSLRENAIVKKKSVKKKKSRSQRRESFKNCRKVISYPLGKHSTYVLKAKRKGTKQLSAIDPDIFLESVYLKSDICTGSVGSDASSDISDYESSVCSSANDTKDGLRTHLPRALLAQDDISPNDDMPSSISTERRRVNKLLYCSNGPYLPAEENYLVRKLELLLRSSAPPRICSRSQTYPPTLHLSDFAFDPRYLTKSDCKQPNAYLSNQRILWGACSENNFNVCNPLEQPSSHFASSSCYPDFAGHQLQEQTKRHHNSNCTFHSQPCMVKEYDERKPDGEICMVFQSIMSFLSGLFPKQRSLFAPCSYGHNQDNFGSGYHGSINETANQWNGKVLPWRGKRGHLLL